MNTNTFNLKKTAQLLCIAAGLSISSSAMASAIIYNTGNAATATVALGVNDLGHLNVTPGNITANASATGLAYKMTPTGGATGWYDATSPGCLCEGWGVAASGVSGYANTDSSGGTANLTSDGMTGITSSSATSNVHLTSMPGLTVSQEYKVSASSDLFEAVVTITNNTGAAVTDTRYRRAMDWDVPFTEFNEYVTIQGTATTSALLTSSDNGFATSNPLGGQITDISSGSTSGCGATTIDTDFVDCGAADHGAVFDFGFGDLADGDSYTFSIFYGATGNEADALTALGTVGAELYSLGQSNGGEITGSPATFIFAFSGVGGEILIPTPEPSLLALLGIGLTGVVAVRRRKLQA